MTEQTIGEWIECVVDNDYEIYTAFPYPIKKKGSYRIIAEWIHRTGYVNCKLNNRIYQKHRIVAQQFIPNPNNLPFIDHINRNRADNRIENLRWVSNSENQRNKASQKGIVYEYFDKIPCETDEDIIEVRDYNEDQFEHLYYCDDFFYVYDGIHYRRLHINYTKRGHYAYVCADSIDNKKCSICYSKFKTLYGLD